MSETVYPADRTAYLLVDPYNDFLSDGGKVYPFIKPIADVVGLLDNLRKLDREVRGHRLPVFFVLDRRWKPGDMAWHRKPSAARRLPLVLDRAPFVTFSLPTCSCVAMVGHRRTGPRAAVHLKTDRRRGSHGKSDFETGRPAHDGLGRHPPVAWHSACVGDSTARLIEVGAKGGYNAEAFRT